MRRNIVLCQLFVFNYIGGLPVRGIPSQQLHYYDIIQFLWSTYNNPVKESRTLTIVC
jgi:hypothetical protein